ncbi:MAG: hypothetical protein FWD40_03325 [Treponema sp.]|nr:hypothetical protein [Treponema sp.]
MKHYKNLLLTICVVLIMPVFAGCADELVQLSQEFRGLKITLSGEAVGSKTLYPEMPSFSKFEITFWHTEGSSQESITLQGDETSVIVEDIALGQWIIYVTGYVEIDGIDYAAAQGNSQIIIVREREQNYLDITLNALHYPYGENGTLVLSLSYPEEKANGVFFRIEPFNNMGLFSDSWYTYESPHSKTISLGPGFYIVSIELYDDYQAVYRVELVHIGSNLETKAGFVITEDDFIDVITISGTLDLRVTGVPKESIFNVFINAYLNSNDIMHYITSGRVDSQENTWSLTIPAFEDEVNISFGGHFQMSGNSRLYYDVNQSILAGNQNISGIDLTVDLHAITLSGTLNISYAGNPVSSAYVYSSYGGYTYIPSPEINSPWSVTIMSLDEPEDISFRVFAQHIYFGVIYDEQIEGLAIQAWNQDISGININIGEILNTLPEDTWIDGEIATSFQEDWYAINVSAGTTYYFWLNNGYEGNSIKTLYAYLCVWEGSTSIHSNGQHSWGSPYAFNPVSDTTVYLRVRGWSNTGTYGIAYNTSGIRPSIDVSGGLAVALPNDTWIDGEIATNFSEDWYAINVSAGTTYYFWLNNGYEGNSIKTLFASLSVWEGSTSIHSNVQYSWGSPLAFNPVSDTTVYLRVRTLNWNLGGTYGIAYNTSGIRPSIDVSEGLAVALPYNTWIDGEITTSGGADWYAINVSAGTMYHFWTNSSWDGNGTKTLPVVISMWYDNSEHFFINSYSYNSPMSFTADYSGTIYIRARCSITSTGTYGLAYNTSGIRPSIDVSEGLAVALPYNTWVDGEIITSGGADWYAIDVSAGTTYHFWLSNRWESISKTMYAALDIWGDSELTHSGIIHSWESPSGFTAASNTTVYIRVRGYTGWGSIETGTYGLAYNTSGIRPIILDISGGQAVALPYDTWLDGEITASSAVDWYAINVSAGTTYYFWTNSLWDGNGTKTMPIVISLWDNNGDHIFENYSYYSAMAFTADFNGIVYIRARCIYASSDTGTYGLAYNTSGTRPD